MKNYSIYDLETILARNNWKETKITCPDGFVVTVTPCADMGKVRNASDCVFFLVKGDMPWMGSENFTQLRREINNHAENLVKWNEEKAKIRAYFEAHKGNWDSDSLSWYSDWHKDVFGYRPHGEVCGEYVEIGGGA